MAINITAIRNKVLQVFNVDDALTTTEMIDILMVQLYLRAVKGKIQSRNNALARHMNGANAQYCINHELPDDTFSNEPDVYIAVYLAEHPGTILDGEELEQAAATDYWAEMDSIDTASGGIYFPLILTPLSAEYARVQQIQTYVRQKETGLEATIDNLIKGAVQLTWKE